MYTTKCNTEIYHNDKPIQRVWGLVCPNLYAFITRDCQGHWPLTSSNNKLTAILTQFLGKGNQEFEIQLNGQKLVQSENFRYLGGIVSTHGGSEADVKKRIDAARGIFQMLHKIWKSKEIHKFTNLRVYEVLVLSVILYNTETWTLKESSKRRLSVWNGMSENNWRRNKMGQDQEHRFGAGSDEPTT